MRREVLRQKWQNGTESIHVSYQGIERLAGKLGLVPCGEPSVVCYPSDARLMSIYENMSEPPDYYPGGLIVHKSS